MSACACIGLFFSLICTVILGIILYFIFKYKPAIEDAVDIINNINDDTIKQISDLVDKVSDSNIINNVNDLNSTIGKVDEVVKQLDSETFTDAVTAIQNVVTQVDTEGVTDAVNVIQNVVTQLDTDKVTKAISTIEDVADQLNAMMEGEDIDKTKLGNAIERYACTNLIPDSYEAKIWDGTTVLGVTIPGISYNFDIRDQVDACKKHN